MGQRPAEVTDPNDSNASPSGVASLLVVYEPVEVFSAAAVEREP
jgi:hypothetical protein